MITALFIITYFVATVVVLAVNDKYIKDLDWIPGYCFYILLAPITIPLSLFIYLAYACYTKFIKPRIDK